MGLKTNSKKYRKGPEIEEFIKKHSSDEVLFWWDAKNEEKKEWDTEKNIRKVLERINGLELQSDLSIPFMKLAVMNVEAILFKTLVTVV